MTRSHNNRRLRALVTGATSGIGLALTERLAQLGVHLVLVARNEARLHEIAENLKREDGTGIAVETLRADLATQDGVDAVTRRLKATEKPVDILVNNAGFGLGDPFERSSSEDERRIIDLMVTAPMVLAHAALPGMRDRRRGWILNVASMAGFLPSGSYSAAKAHVISLSRSLRVRYRRDGVRVTALCPGFVHTEFHERMGTGEQAPAWMWTTADVVAREGIRGLRGGKAVVRSDWRYRLLAPLIAVLPDRALHRLTG